MHRGMLLLLTLACPLAVVPHRAIASEVDWQKELLEETVEIKEDKMVIEEFGLLSIPSAPDASMQLKLYSEAPAAGVVSRDNLVAISAMLQTTFMLEVAMALAANTNAESLRDLFDYKELDEPIGNVDVEINLYMSKRWTTDRGQGHQNRPDKPFYDNLERVLQELTARAECSSSRSRSGPLSPRLLEALHQLRPGD